MWYGSLRGRWLKRRGLLAGAIDGSELVAFRAWCMRRRFAGKTIVVSSKRGRMLDAARNEIGVCEHPHGSNSGKRVSAYQAATTLGGSGWPWCSAFVVWCATKSGMQLPDAARSASVFALTAWARDAGRLVGDRAPRAGDVVVLFGEGKHVGIVTKFCTDGGVDTIEGNTSSGDSGSQDNGGGVYARHRAANQIIHLINLGGL